MLLFKTATITTHGDDLAGLGQRTATVIFNDPIDGDADYIMDVLASAFSELLDDAVSIELEGTTESDE